MLYVFVKTLFEFFSPLFISKKIKKFRVFMFKQNKKYFFQKLDGANLNSVDNFRTLVMNKVTDYKCVFFPR